MDDRPAASDSTGPPDQGGGPLADAYDAAAPALYRYAVMILADPAAAEDAVHQAFAKLAGMGDRIARIGDLRGYLRVAVRNECYRILRRRAGRERVESASPMLESAEEAPADEELRLALERALRALPPEQREVVHLKVYEQQTFRQIADQLNVSINTAASRYRYAIEKLRALLGRHVGEEGHGNE